MRLSTVQFAKYLGVTGRMVNKWEAGGEAIVPRPVNQAAFDTCLARSGRAVQARFTVAMGWPLHNGDLSLSMLPGQPATRVIGGDHGRYEVNLMVTSVALSAVMDLASDISYSLVSVLEIDTNGTTVSVRGKPNRCFRVFCDRQLSYRGQCVGRYGHGGECSGDANLTATSPLHTTSMDASSNLEVAR